jgi:precorrin-6B methylase 2
VHGQTFYEYLHCRPETASTFDRAMTAFSEQEAAAILAAYDFSTVSTLVDVGAGQGALMAAILRAHPHARAILFDQHSVVEHGGDVAARAGVIDRCDIASGDFFEAVPAGGDLYVLKSVLHNWDDRESVSILKNCRDAMSHTARLVIVERVVPEGNGSSEAKLFDINMLVVPGGLERTAEEYRKILDQAGFELTRVIPTAAPVSIVESAPQKS